MIRNTFLEGVRVLEIAGESAAIAGRLLADLGAEVILVEPSEGCDVRRRAPFAGGRPDLERSYRHLAWNANKRSVVIEPGEFGVDGRLAGLVASADVLLTTDPPSPLAGRARELADPHIVQAVVAPFGDDTVWRERQHGSDLVATAAGGLLQVCGDADQPPTRGGARPVDSVTSLLAAAGVVIALVGRERTRGRPGTRMDVSQQDAALFTVAQTSAIFQYRHFGEIPRRPGMRMSALCADGRAAAVTAAPNAIPSFVELLDEVGIEHPLSSEDFEWTSLVTPMLWRITESPLQTLSRALAARWPREELLRKLLEAGHLAIPTISLPEMLGHEHFEAAEQFVEIEDDLRGEVFAAPQTPLRFGKESVELRRAPGLGEDDERLIPRSPVAGSAGSVPDPFPARPLAGIRVVDFSWAIAGPLGTRMMASFGAEVIRIESSQRPDAVRNFPFRGTEIDPNLSGQYNVFNAGKQSVSLDLTHERARRLVHRLIDTADVVVDNFSDGALARMGFDWATLSARNPGLIVAHMPGVGGSSPWRSQRTLGFHLLAASGFDSLTGSDDRPSSGMGVAYPDFTSPPLILMGVLGALLERGRTGRGRELTISQIAATTSLLAPEWMEFRHTGDAPVPQGNRDPNYAPHSVYAALGEETWCAIAVSGDEQWRRMAEVMGRPELAEDRRFSTHAARKQHECALDEEVSSWTRTLDKWAIGERLQRVGVAASPVEDLRDLLEIDPAGRQRVQDVRQPGYPDWEIPIEREPIRFDGRRPDLERAPMIGEHNERVLCEVLGLSEDEYASLVIDDIAR